MGLAAHADCEGMDVRSSAAVANAVTRRVNITLALFIYYIIKHGSAVVAVVEEDWALCGALRLVATLAKPYVYVLMHGYNSRLSVFDTCSPCWSAVRWAFL